MKVGLRKLRDLPAKVQVGPSFPNSQFYRTDHHFLKGSNLGHNVLIADLFQMISRFKVGRMI